MKKYLSHNRDSRDNPRQRADEGKSIPKHGSFERKHYPADENTSMGFRSGIYQVERRSKADFQHFVKPKENHSIQNHDYKQTRCSTYPTNKYPDVNKSNKDTEYFDSRENYNRIHNAPSLNQNKGNAHLQLDNRISKSAISKMAIKIKNGVSPVNDTEDEKFDKLRSSNELSVSEGNRSVYLDVHKSHVEEKSPLKRYSISIHESDQSYQEENYQTNAYPRNISVHKEGVNSQCYSGTQKTPSLSDSASYKYVGLDKLKLEDLLYYNTNLMQGDFLFEYASAVKCKILEKIDRFQPPEKDELKVLCEISDGDQSEKNQQIITTRTCDVVKNILEKFPLLLNTQEVLHSSQTANQTTQDFHGIVTNGYCSNNISPTLEIVSDRNLNTQEVLHSSQTTNQTTQDFHGIVTNGYCSNNVSPTFEIVSDRNTVTSTTDYNLMPEYNIGQNDKCAISKEISDVFHIERSNYCTRNGESQNFNTRKSSPVNSSSITKDKNRQTLSEHCYSQDEDSREPVPVNKFSFNRRKSIFIVFELDDLLKYDVYAMQGDMVFDYGFSMKKRILENIDKFMDPYKEKLEFLCELTDGTQREENQLLINERMCLLIDSAYERGYVLDDSQQLSNEPQNLYPKDSHYSDNNRGWQK